MSKKTVGTMQVLTDAEKFFIEEKVKGGEGLAKIVAAVGKDEALVKEFIGKMKPVKPKSQFELARGEQKSVGGKAKVAVGTAGMSEAGDAAGKALRGGFEMKYSNSMAKIKE